MAPNPRSSASAPKTARAAALALVSRRDYTTAELAARLQDKEYDADAIAAAIDFLRASRFVDDHRVAAAHVRTATAIKGRGRVRIARELAARGLDAEIIEDVLQGIEPETELASIRKILTRKRWPAKPTRPERDRMFRHLFARGFPADVISKALGRPMDDDNDD